MHLDQKQGVVYFSEGPSALSATSSSSKALASFQIERIEPLAKPAVDRSEKLAGLISLPLIAPECAMLIAARSSQDLAVALRATAGHARAGAPEPRAPVPLPSSPLRCLPSLSGLSSTVIRWEFLNRARDKRLRKVCVGRARHRANGRSQWLTA